VDAVSAVFSPCRTWRYTLTREWGLLGCVGGCRADAGAGLHEPECKTRLRTVTFIGLNPSTADETQDDPTVRRCIGFARSWGFDRMVMLNAFAFRATNPRRLRQADDPVGPANNHHLVEQASTADLVVAAWGNHALWHPLGIVTRQEEVKFLLAEFGVELHALGMTKLGAPKHPLYLRADLMPVPW
jgi:hypothetical protein